jgi:hypothetical protein
MDRKDGGILYKKILDSLMRVADTYPNPGIQFRNADAGLFALRSVSVAPWIAGSMFDIDDNNY